MTMQVEIGKLGEPTLKYTVEDGATVEDVLLLANLEVSGGTKVMIDGDEVEMSDDVEDGDLLILTIAPKNGA